MLVLAGIHLLLKVATRRAVITIVCTKFRAEKVLKNNS